MNIIASKKFLIVISLIGVSIITILILTLFSISPKTFENGSITIPTPIGNTNPLPFQEKIYSGQKVVIGKTTEDEVKELPGLISETDLGDEKTGYTFTSDLTNRPNMVITQNGFAIYERALTPPLSVFPKISEYSQRYGPPDQIIQGSKQYGWVANNYIYSTKGLVFVGNPNTDEIYEFQFLVPQSVDSYTQNYGDDLNAGEKPPEEIPY